MDQLQRTAVLGGGTMGHGIAQFFALIDIPVSLLDQNQEMLNKARESVRLNLQTMVELGELEQDRVDAVLDNITFTTDMAEAVDGVQMVTEAVFENLDLKRGIFTELGNLTEANVILATNTSSYDINEFTKVARFPERVLGTHWFFPPQIIPCIEVIPADATDPQVVKDIIDMYERLGKAPTPCKSSPGFVANRIQFAMASEALKIIEEGLASPAELDRIVKTSFGFRLGAYGPCEIMDQAGLDIYNAIYEYFYEKFGREHFKPPKILTDLTGKNRSGLKNGKGFYEYEGDAQTKMKRERDEKFYDRLKLYKKEFGAT